MIAAILDSGQHEMAAQAETVEEALAIVEDMQQGNLEVDAVLLDGNLDSYQVHCDDAKRIALAMKEAGLTTPIVGISAYELQKIGIPVDVDITKTRLMTLNNALDAL